MSDGYTKLDNGIVTSSIWSEDSDTRVVWITALAMSDFEGNLQASITGLARMANVSVLACEKALKKLMSPDKYSKSKEHEGRRLEQVDGGWKVLNKAFYRDKDYSRAEYYRKWRAKRKITDDKKQKETEMSAARMVVNRAIESGKLLPIDDQMCSRCGNQAELYHHVNGYDKQHQLDVIPVCILCHKLLHKK